MYSVAKQSLKHITRSQTDISFSYASYLKVSQRACARLLRGYVGAVERRLIRARRQVGLMVILAWSQMLIVKKAAGAVSDEPLILSDVLLDPKAETGARTRLRRLRSEHRLRRFEVFGPFLGVLFEVAIDAHGTEQPLTLLPRSINDFITVVRSRDASRPDGRYRVVGSQDEQVVLSPESRRGRNILATFMFIVLHREIAVTQVLPVEQNTTARELRHANMELTLINSELQQRLGAKEVEVVSLRSELKLVLLLDFTLTVLMQVNRFLDSGQYKI